MAVVNLDETARVDLRGDLVAGLLDAGLVDSAAVDRARLVAQRTGQPLEQILNQLGALTDEDLVAAYARATGCQIWEPSRDPIMTDVSELGVSAQYLSRARLAPLRDAEGVLTCAACDPLDRQAVAGVVFATGREVEILVARPADWRTHVGTETATADTSFTDERRLEREIDLVADGVSDGAGAKLVTAVFEAAIAAGASDIHFEPRRHDLRIRLRVDGQLVDHRVVGADLAAPAVSRVKVIANLDLGEKRLPQDGRTTFVVGGRQVDVRVATSPSVFGESAVLRILDRTTVPLDLDTLGLNAGVTETLRRVARAPHGLFLMTGPTGSGKTTTLYALLQSFAGSAKKVLSVEDPVEFHFEHVSQTQVATQVGLTFARALRSFLRQDPDVILVGEIRDPETASVAVQAAMTGHLVFASVHANHAIGVVPRLVDMGIEPYQLASAFRGAAAQRLVRKLCLACREERAPSEAERIFAQEHGLPAADRGWASRGCPACGGTGFRGRLAIGEAFLSTEPLLRALAHQPSLADLSDIVSAGGFQSMAVDGFLKATEGLTAFEDVVAAVDE